VHGSATASRSARNWAASAMAARDTKRRRRMGCSTPTGVPLRLRTIVRPVSASRSIAPDWFRSSRWAVVQLIMWNSEIPVAARTRAWANGSSDLIRWERAEMTRVGQVKRSFPANTWHVNGYIWSHPPTAGRDPIRALPSGGHPAEPGGGNLYDAQTSRGRAATFSSSRL